jgi:glycosyltransferase involved in cell wall biosynthesis
MRIVFLVPSLLMGGAETMVVHLASWLHERGEQVEVLFFEDGDTLLPELIRRGVPATRLRLARYVWRFYPRRLIRHLMGRRDVILHGHLYAWHKAIAAARWTDAACVYTQHSCVERWIRKEWRAMKRSARRTDAAVAVSHETLSLLVDRLGIPRERAHYVPNGVPDIYDPHRPAVEWGAAIPADAAVIGMVARLAWPKDPDTLLDAALLVRSRIPSTHLVFAGGGPEESRLRKRIRERNAEAFVHLLGQRRDVARLLHRFDVFALSSLTEGHSMAILEAMSARRAIVATGVGGNPHLLDGGKCGILTPPGDAQGMAEAIVRLLRSPDEAERLAARARQRFLEHYTLDRMGEAYLTLYADVIASRVARAGSGG